MTFALAYGASIGASLALSDPDAPFATFWLPSGLLLAALLRTEPARWWTIVAGSVAGTVVVDGLVIGRPFALVAGFALSNALEAVSGAVLLRASGGIPHLRRIGSVLRLAGVALAVAAVPGALLGTSVVHLLGGDPAASIWQTWRTWWIADMAGILVLAPLLLTERRDWRMLADSLRGPRAVEALLAAGGAWALAWLVYWHPPSPLRAAFLMLPCLLWVTCRFAAPALMVSLAVAGAIAVRGTLAGHGPVAQVPGSPDAVLVVQMVVSVGALCLLTFAAALREREDSVDALEQRDQDARVRLFADTAPAILWAAGLDARRTFISRGWYELTGLPEGTGLGDRWLESVHPDDRGVTMSKIAEALANGAPYQHRYRLRTAEGSHRWVMSAGRPQRDDRGRVLGYVGSIIDVNDYTLAADALAKADALLDAVFQGAPVGLAFLDRDLRFRRINERLAAINGLPNDAHIGRTPLELLPGIENMEPMMADFRRILDTGQSRLGVEVSGETPAAPGVRHFWRENFFPVSVNGEVVGLGVVAEDVTDQRRTVQALRASEARFRKLAEAGPVIVWVTGPGGVEYLSPRWTEYTGLPTPGARAVTELLEPVHPDDRPGVRHEWFASDADSPLETEFRLRRHDGAYRWFLGRGVAIAGDDGGIVQRVGAYVDIHDRKVAEGELLDAGRRKDEFLAMLAHELRNPLAPIQNAVHILKIADASSAAHAAARDIVSRQLAHIVRLVDDLLDVSRLSRGKLSIKREVLDLVDIVTDAATDMRPSFDERGIHFTLDVPRQPVWIDGDRTRLAQVVGNLLHNAQKYTPTGGAVCLTLQPDFARGEARIRVADTGVGMTEELRGRVFDEFSQGAQTLDRGQGGLGLGLALVKRFATLHGGDAEAHSEGPGRGSAFVVRLPARATALPQETVPATDAVQR